MEKIEIDKECIKLDQFLKLAAIVSTGGEAKQFILSQKILVNDEAENRRGRKLRHGDVIKIGQEIYTVEQAGV